MPFANKMAVSPTATPERMTKRVYCTSTGAIKKGMAMVYDYAATVSGVSPDRCVCIPTSSKKYYFAGVAYQDYAANAAGQFIDIVVPGSSCECLVGPAGTAGSTVVVMSQTDGKFGVKTSEVGCGTALMLETVAAPTSAGKLVLCKLLEGTDCVAPAYSDGGSSSSSSGA